MIGSAIARDLQQSGVSWLGTSRRPDHAQHAAVFLDLSDITGIALPRVDVAVLCAGVTRLQECARDPAQSRSVNVDGMAALAARLVSDGAFVIYLSTNQVFDGTRPARLADDAVCPVTEYGRQKSEAEARIRAHGDRAAIVRLTKVLGESVPLFDQWLRGLAAADPIHPFSDMTMAPVSLGTVVSAVRMVGDGREPGTFQVSGDVDVTYAEAALFGASLVNADRRLVQPRTVAASGLLSEPSPPYTSLNVERLVTRFGMPVPGTWQAIDEAFRNTQRSGDITASL